MNVHSAVVATKVSLDYTGLVIVIFMIFERVALPQLSREHSPGQIAAYVALYTNDGFD